MSNFDGFRIARDLMDQHGLKDWKLRWMERGSSTTGGKCWGGKKLIEFNRMYFVMTEDKSVCRNTILHEIAHALDFEKRGASDHGPRWKSIAISIGCTGDRCTEGMVLPKRGRVGLYKCGVQIEED